MKPALLLTSLLVTMAVGWAQDPTPSPTPAPAVRRPPAGPVRSPEIGGDRMVTFRLRAPKAAEVVLNGQWPDGRTNLVRGSNEVWAVTVGPIPAGVWEYSFTVDGLGMIDPGNPAIKPMREPRTSILHLPSTPPRPFDYQDVPHGVVHSHSYWSRALGRLRELAVYTPPGYERGRMRYPVLFLQHGSGDNQATWVVHGKAHWILDSLLAAGRAKPMVVVMMDGHAAMPGVALGGPQSNTALFERDLLEEVVPFVELHYRLRAGAAHRAIAGLSMGGGQALTIGLNHADRFAWVGGFSAAPPSREAVTEALAQPARTNERLQLLWIACGKDDFLLQRNQDFTALLKEGQVKHEWLLTEGNHSWPVWRDYLADFLPRLF